MGVLSEGDRVQVCGGKWPDATITSVSRTYGYGRYIFAIELDSPLEGATKYSMSECDLELIIIH